MVLWRCRVATGPSHAPSHLIIGPSQAGPQGQLTGWVPGSSQTGQ